MDPRKRWVTRRRCDVGVDDGSGEKETEGWSERKRWEKGRRRELRITSQEETREREEEKKSVSSQDSGQQIKMVE